MFLPNYISNVPLTLAWLLVQALLSAFASDFSPTSSFAFKQILCQPWSPVVTHLYP